MQVLVVLVPEGDEPAGLEDLVRGQLGIEVVAVAGQERAGAAEDGDGPFALFGHGSEQQREQERHLR